MSGKRGLFAGNNFYTHFCYSNPEARKILVDTIIEYVQERPYVDFVHVWLADATNNQCECEECRKMHPSDHYVKLLNELDEALEELDVETRIVFIGYVETERPPRELTLANPKRFVFLSAIGLHYEKGYKKITELPLDEEPEYKLNDFHPAPDTVRMKWRMDWKKACGNVPNVIFEYRFYTDMYCDLGHMQISGETYRDMKDLAEVGFEGCMNDQTHRMYMPTSLPLITMGEKLSELLCPSNFRVGGNSGVEETGLGNIETQKRSWINNSYVAENATKIPMHLAEFIPVIERNMAEATDPAKMLSWRYLKYHSEICGRLYKVLLAGAKGDMEEARRCYFVLEEYLFEHELEFHKGFDLFLYERAMRLKLGISLVPYYD